MSNNVYIILGANGVESIIGDCKEYLTDSKKAAIGKKSYYGIFDLRLVSELHDCLQTIIENRVVLLATPSTKTNNWKLLKSYQKILFEGNMEETWFINLIEKYWPLGSAMSPVVNSQWAHKLHELQFYKTSNFMFGRVKSEISLVPSVRVDYRPVLNSFLEKGWGMPLISSLNLDMTYLGQIMLKLGTGVSIKEIYNQDLDIKKHPFNKKIKELQKLALAWFDTKDIAKKNVIKLLKGEIDIKNPRITTRTTTTLDKKGKPISIELTKDEKRKAEYQLAYELFSDLIEVHARKDPSAFNLEKLTFYNPVVKSERDIPFETVLEHLRDNKLTEKDITRLTDYIVNNVYEKEVIIPAARTGAGFELEPWQTRSIAKIRDGQSLLIIGPTSGGKTTLALYALEIFNKIPKTKKVLVYVAPTFHLALQEFANISKTFEGVSLVTGIINTIVKDCQIWVGTPDCLNSYFTAINMTFDIGIFDEVHTLSTEFDTSYEGFILARSLSSLMQRCKEQIIALSATINETDVKKLADEISKRVIFKNIIEIENYRVRSIKLEKKCYINKNLINLDRLAACPRPDPITSDKIFNLLKMMSLPVVPPPNPLDPNANMFPALMFSLTEADCYNTFVRLVRWIKNKVAVDYFNWEKIQHSFEKKVSEYNSLFNNCPEGRISELTDRRNGLLQKIIDKLQFEYHNSENAEHVRNEFKTELDAFIKSKGDTTISTIMYPCKNTGSYYKVGTQWSEYKCFDMMLHGGEGEALKLKKLAENLTEAERISKQDVEPLLRLLDEGLQFGISIILPTMPFIVQYKMLELLKSKKIAMLFCSKSFSMGINMPVRTVIISSELDGGVLAIPPTVCEVMQMEGRAGRRGMGDAVGNVIYWNLANSKDILDENIPLMLFPESDTKGSRIEDFEKVASEIISHISDFENPLKTLELTVSNLHISKKSPGAAGSDSSDIHKLIEIICSPIVDSINISRSSFTTILPRIFKIATGKITGLDGNVYKYAEAINSINKCIQELHTRYHLLKNPTGKIFLQFLSTIYEVLHQVIFIQLRLGLKVKAEEDDAEDTAAADAEEAEDAEDAAEDAEDAAEDAEDAAAEDAHNVYAAEEDVAEEDAAAEEDEFAPPLDDII